MAGPIHLSMPEPETVIVLKPLLAHGGTSCLKFWPAKQHEAPAMMPKDFSPPARPIGRRTLLSVGCGLAGWGMLRTLPARAATESDAALLAFFAENFAAQADQSPERRTRLGLPGDHSGWDDLSDTALAMADLRLADNLARLRRDFPDATLSAAGRLNKRLWEYQAEDRLGDARWRGNAYPADHFNGRHGEIIDLLSTYHPLRDTADAQAWITRVRTIDGPVDQLIQALDQRAARGVIPPRFSVEKTLQTVRNVLIGRPFEPEGEVESALLSGFRNRLGRTDLPLAEQTALVTAANNALREFFTPAWTRLSAALTRLLGQADDRDGVWKLPQGKNYYRWCLRHHTTLDLEPEMVHALGLQEVRRLQDEMAVVKAKTGFDGDLIAFNHFLRSDPQFHFPDTDEGRSSYLAGARQILDRVKAALDGQFNLKPKAPLEVRRFDLYRESSETIARYSPPAADGSRPGIYYVNLSNMKEMPTWQMEVLAFHEGLPGHHMQMALAQELTGLPEFRRHQTHTAFVEGWGLYSERLPKELGFYDNAYADFGRLSFELWRAIRLVLDTGIHAKRWSRQQAIDYFTANSAFTAEVAAREVDRYIVYPGQACAYYLGMRKLLELREKAKKELAHTFDIKGFHDAVLSNGSVPLEVLEQVVKEWIASHKA